MLGQVKTVKFHITGVTRDQGEALTGSLRALGAAARTAVKTALMEVADKDLHGVKDAYWQGVQVRAEQSAREAFKETGYSPAILNEYWNAFGFTGFKIRWSQVRKGERTSIPFPGDAPFLQFTNGATIQVAETEDGYCIRRIRIYGLVGNKPDTRNEVEWALKPVGRGRHAAWGIEQLRRANKICAVRIHKAERGWIAAVSVRIQAEAVAASRPERWAGIDLGLNSPAVLSVPDANFSRFYGRDLYSGLWRSLDEYEARKRELVRAGKKQAARDLDDRISAKRKHINELISRQIVDDCRRLRVTGIRLEDLKGIQQFATGRLKHWPRHNLALRIEQKAAEVGIETEMVRPAYTSLTCSHCGHMEKDNRSRENVSLFLCRRCGFSRHADLNGANNIARKLERFGIEEPNLSVFERAEQPRLHRLGATTGPEHLEGRLTEAAT